MMSRKDRIAMYCCFLIVFVPVAALLFFAFAPDAQVNYVLAYVDCRRVK
jgi:hypothetical protein